MGKQIGKFATPYVAFTTVLGMWGILALVPHRTSRISHPANDRATILRRANQICSESFLQCTALTQPIYHPAYYWSGRHSSPYNVWETTGITPTGPVQMFFDARTAEIIYLNRENYQGVWDKNLPITLATKTQALLASASVLKTLHLVPIQGKAHLVKPPYLLWGQNVWETIWQVDAPRQSPSQLSLTLARRGGNLIMLIRRHLSKC